MYGTRPPDLLLPNKACEKRNPRIHPDAGSKCEKGDYAVKLRNLPDGYHVIETFQHYTAPNDHPADDPPDDEDPEGSDDEDDEDEDGDDEGDGQDWHGDIGQSDDSLEDGSSVLAWRPTKPAFRALGQPETCLVFFNEEDETEPDFIFAEFVERTWPDLTLKNWIKAHVHHSAQSCEGISSQHLQMVAIDAQQFPITSNWRGGVAAVELRLDADATSKATIDVFAWAALMPIDFDTALAQLEIELPGPDFNTRIWINGVLTRPGEGRHHLRHGFFIHVLVTAEELDHDSFDLETLLRTPSNDPDYPRDRTPSPEVVESEHETDDPAVTLFSPSSAASSGNEAQCEQSPGLENWDEIETIKYISDATDADDDDSCCSSTECRTNQELSECNSLGVIPVDVSLGHQDSFPSSLVEHSPKESFSCESVGRILRLSDHLDFHAESGPSLTKVQNVCPQHNSTRRPISLELLIPEAPAHTPVKLPDLSTFQQLTCRANLQLQVDIPIECPLRGSTRTWFTTHEVSMEFLPYVHIFTDGSAVPDEELAAWAFAVFSSPCAEPLEAQAVFHGWLTGPVVLDESHPHYIGAKAPDSTSSEASAMFWAIAFTLSRWTDIGQIAFHFDALTVGSAAVGTFGFSEKFPIVGNVRLLMQALEALMQPWNIHAHHVRGHQDHPLNELVDTLAGYCRDKVLHPAPGCDFRRLLAQDAFALRWLWLLARLAQPDCQELPPREGDNLLLPDRAQLSGLPGQVPWTFGYGENVNLVTTDKLSFDLKLVTFNVRSLKDPVPEPFTFGSHTLLEAQLVDLGIEVIGLQETRSRQSCMTSSKHFEKFNSAANQGHGGVALWISKTATLAFLGQRPLKFQSSSAIVLHASC